MDYIVAASNLRAENYEIDPADRHKVRTFTHTPHQIPGRCVSSKRHRRGDKQKSWVEARLLPLGHAFSLFCTHLPRSHKNSPLLPIVAGAELITALYLSPGRWHLSQGRTHTRPRKTGDLGTGWWGRGGEVLLSEGGRKGVILFGDNITRFTHCMDLLMRFAEWNFPLLLLCCSEYL